MTNEPIRIAADTIYKSAGEETTIQVPDMVRGPGPWCGHAARQHVPEDVVGGKLVASIATSEISMNFYESPKADKNSLPSTAQPFGLLPWLGLVGAVLSLIVMQLIPIATKNCAASMT